MPRLTILGSGDAFGSGGRLFSGYLVESSSATFLLECGPTTLQGLKRGGHDPTAVDFVLISHLHGDHFGGLPFLFMDHRYETLRERPIEIYGPTGLEKRTTTLFETLYPHIGDVPSPFPIGYHEFAGPTRLTIGDVVVEPFLVTHVPELTCLGYRVQADGKTLCFSGDSAWTPALADAAAGADLFLCECSTYETPLAIHVSYPEIASAASDLGCKRLILTHLGSEPLERLAELNLECAEDGMTIEL
jgi:ribonuclease BN (tRNA processing enzyme)